MFTAFSESREASGDDLFRWGCWFVLLNVIDGFQTMAVVGQFGLRAEFNPWIGWWISHYSFAGLWLVKLIFMSAVLLMRGSFRISILRGVTFGLSAIVMLNFLTAFNRF
ncbi:MAG: DUF5658 family protein [Planctomycetota bacterium]